MIKTIKSKENFKNNPTLLKVYFVPGCATLYQVHSVGLVLHVAWWVKTNKTKRKIFFNDFYLLF